MRKLFLLIICFAFIFAGKPASSETYFNFEEYGGTWADADKDYVDDLFMCWAGAASNVLYWTGWADFMSDEEEVFDHFVDRWTNGASWPLAAYKYWIDGTNLYEGYFGYAQIDVEGGGNFYPDEDVFDYTVNRSFYNTGDAYEAIPMIVDLLHNGYGVSIAITSLGTPTGL